MTADCILALSMRRFLSALVPAIAWSALVAYAQTATAFVGARLIDGTGAAPIADAVVIVEGERITGAGPRARVAIPRGATTVDAAGKTLIPGLVDVHCHINQ